jgi:hypothetical protein
VKSTTGGHIMEIITTAFYEKFMDLCANSHKSIRLCAPFVKNDVVANVMTVRKASATVDLITKVSLKNFHNKASDVGALDKILMNGGAVYNCSNLHAKIYIFDESQCVITSANITTSGFKRNIECGVLSNDSTTVTSVINFYEEICQNNDVGRISNRTLSEITNLLERLPAATAIRYPRFDVQSDEHDTSDENLLTIAENLAGWKKDVFLALGQFDDEFTTREITTMAEILKLRYPLNNNREAKIRQVLQQLRDLGLVEFVRPGVYKKLWV